MAVFRSPDVDHVRREGANVLPEQRLQGKLIAVHDGLFENPVAQLPEASLAGFGAPAKDADGHLRIREQVLQGVVDPQPVPGGAVYGLLHGAGY